MENNKLQKKNKQLKDKTTGQNVEAAKAILVTGYYNIFHEVNYQFLLDEKKWVKVKKFPESPENVHVYGVFEISNVIYVVRGNGILTLSNEVHKLPSNKLHYWCGSCKVENKILVIRKVFESLEGDESILFDAVNKQWSLLNIETGRVEFDVVHYLNKIWIVGGRDDEDDESDEYEDFNIFNTIQIYDLVNRKLSLSPVKMLQARYGHKVIVYKKKLFVFGGCNTRYSFSNCVEMYSPDANKFLMLAPMKNARRDFGCCRVGNLVYVFGGKISQNCCTDSVEIYNLDKNTWFDGTKLPFHTDVLQACAVSNKLEF